MTRNATTYSTRPVSLLMLAAFAGLALWLFAPWGGGAGSGSGNGGSASAALPSSLQLDGAVQVESHDNVVTRLIVPLSVRGDQGIVLAGVDARIQAETAMSDTAVASVPSSFSVRFLDGNGDQVLDPGEHTVMTVDLPSKSSVRPGNPLNLVIYPANGGRLTIEDVLGR